MREPRSKKMTIPAPLADEALRFMYDLKVLSTCDFSQEWAGWKMRGAWLVSPEGVRLTPERLRGIFFAESARVKSSKNRSRDVDSVIVQFRKNCRAAALTNSGE